jgi:hypothetical protein
MVIMSILQSLHRQLSRNRGEQFRGTPRATTIEPPTHEFDPRRFVKWALESSRGALGFPEAPLHETEQTSRRRVFFRPKLPGIQGDWGTIALHKGYFGGISKLTRQLTGRI